MNMMAGAKPVTSKQMREERIDRNIYIVGLEKVVPSLPLRKIKTPTTFIEGMNEAEVTPITDFPRNKRVLGINCVFSVSDGRFKGRLVSLCSEQSHGGTDCAIVAAKDDIGP